MTPTEKLASLDLTLPDVPAPVASYENCVRSGNLLHISGGLPIDEDGDLIRGKVPSSISERAAKEAAGRIVLNRLAVVRDTVGSIDKVTRIVSISGFVNSEPDFFDHPNVINGASDLLVEIFGDAGRHARIALGAAALPLNVAVEISMIVEVSD